MVESLDPAPRVSVVVPYLRAESTIERALASVLRQTIADIEVIAVGDGTTDRSRSLVEAMQRDDGRIRTIAYADNRGPGFARNRGIEAARGEWIAVLDADDWYAPDRLETMLEGSGDADVLVDNLMGVDPVDGRATGILFPKLPPALTVEQIVAAHVTGSSYNFGYLKPLLRRAFLVRHDLRYREALRTAEDLLLLAECAVLGGPIRTVDRAGYFYNLQFSPTTRRPSGTSHSLPVDRMVAVALDDLLATRRAVMSDAQIAAVIERRDRLVRDADVSAFRHAVKVGHYGNAVALLATSTRVRSYVSRTVVRKLGGRAGR